VAHGERLRPAVAAHLISAGVDCPIYFDLLEAMIREGPPRDFDGVDCPVLIAWGTQDRTLPARRHAAALTALVPQAELVDLEDAGHVPMLDDPDTVGRLILDFAARAEHEAGAAESRGTI
jgi:pimeloyl-ACP methyl ester carboxylesterase